MLEKRDTCHRQTLLSRALMNCGDHLHITGRVMVPIMSFVEPRNIFLVYISSPWVIEIQLFFYKQPGYKQLALRCQIAKQRSGFNPLLLSNNKKYRLKKVEFFLCNKRKIIVKPTIH